MKNLDHKISKWIYDRAHASPTLAFFAVIGARYMIFVMAVFLLLITPAFFTLVHVVIIGATWFVTFVLQMVIRRKRPFECKIYEAKIPLMCKTPSFPSAHASISFTISFLSYAALHWWASNVYFISSLTVISITAIFFLCALWIALSRVAVGVHYVSDVIVGALIGLLTPVFIFLLFSWF